MWVFISFLVSTILSPPPFSSSSSSLSLSLNVTSACGSFVSLHSDISGLSCIYHTTCSAFVVSAAAAASLSSSFTSRCPSTFIFFLLLQSISNKWLSLSHSLSLSLTIANRYFSRVMYRTVKLRGHLAIGYNLCCTNTETRNTFCTDIHTHDRLSNIFFLLPLSLLFFYFYLSLELLFSSLLSLAIVPLDWMSQSLRLSWSVITCSVGEEKRKVTSYWMEKKRRWEEEEEW